MSRSPKATSGVLAVAIILVILAGVAAIGYVAWSQDPKNRFHKTRRQIRRLKETPEPERERV